MSIDCFTGIPGSGKSLHCASEIRFALQRRYPRPVLANFPLGPDAPIAEDRRELFHYIPNEEMSARRITRFAEDFWTNNDIAFREDYIILAIDECQLLFNSRNWSQNSRMSYLEFLSQSRKYGIKVILIAQNAKMIDNQFRMLVDVEYNHRRVSSMGPVGALIALPFRGRLFMVVRRLWQVQERLGMSLFTARKADMMMYDSYARFERQDG